MNIKALGKKRVDRRFFGSTALVALAACATNPSAGGSGDGGETGNTGGTGGVAGYGGGGGSGGAGGGASPCEGNGGAGGFQEPTEKCDFALGLPTKEILAGTFLLVDPLAATGEEGILVEACERSDLACLQPYDAATTDSMGYATVWFPAGATGFDGFFRFTAPGKKDTVFFTANPLIDDINVIWLAFDQAQFELVSQIYCATADPAKGHIAAILYECSADAKTAAVGSTLATIPAAQTIGYTGNMLPDATATFTDSTGVSVAVNVPLGDVTLYNVNMDGVLVGTATVPVLPDTITLVHLTPVP